MDIVILGSGNVANQFANNFHEQGHKIAQIYSRTKANADALAFAVQAEAIDQIEQVKQDADLYLIAVSDQAIEIVANSLDKNLKGIVSHCSGATDLNVLDKFKNHAVIYPPQSISKHQDIDFSKIPFCIEANNQDSVNRVMDFILPIAPKSLLCDSQQRIAIHVSSVFANNFSNVLFQIAYELLEKHKLPFDLVRPIILETAQKVQNKLPFEVQTGPAVRNDENTLKKHLNFISDREDWTQIYQLLTQQIIKRKS